MANILFVDDEENILKSLKRALIDEKYSCYFADSAKKGLEIIKNNEIDVVVSDMRMPEIDGLKFLQQVQAISPDIVKIIQSGQADMYQLISVINTIDVFNFILKPWDIDLTLKPIINKAISQAKLIKSNKELNKELAEKLRELEIKHFRLEKLTESLEDSNSVIITIANAVEAKDMETNGHVNRVAYLSQKIGEKLELSHGEIDILMKGAILHDIGKIGIPDIILNKPGPLTAEEFEIMKTHTIIGENIIKSLKSFEGIRGIIRHHHEKLDGSGYPDGLNNGQIDIYTRIVAIVDIYDALTSDRPYRKCAMSQEQAFTILKNDVKKGLLDKTIVEILEKEILENPNSNFLTNSLMFR
ncbi:MAG: HD domain-containing protein [Candidatus Gastranaerophilales bacterium]|nr:HD domain-containing protein [Candidatus Gastranaerophilales bacterium]